MKSQFFENGYIGTVLSCTAESFLIAAKNNPQFKLKSIVVLVPNDDETAYLDANDAFFAGGNVSLLVEQLTSRVDFIAGGNTRQESVKNALDFLKNQEPDFVAIHDGARPWVRPELIEECLKKAVENGNCSPIIDIVDTVKTIDDSTMQITSHLVRDTLGAIQTPQIFTYKTLLTCHEKATKENFVSTDDTEIWSKFSGEKTYFCKGNKQNKKITYAQDIPVYKSSSEQLANENPKNRSLASTSPLECEQNADGNLMDTCPTDESLASENATQALPRIGLGYDLHRLVPGRNLMLGGVKIEYDKGEDGHSDGDVLLHAITDSLLGAAGLGDIGEFFPPNDEKWKNADSKKLLEICWQQILDKGWKLGNLDCVINIEKPKILPYREQIRKSIADILGCDISRVFVKAKTAEKTGDIGNGQAVQVWASAILYGGNA